MPAWRLLCPPLGPFAHNPVDALRQCLQDAIHVGKMCTQDWSVSAKFAYSPHNKCCGDFSLRTHEQAITTAERPGPCGTEALSRAGPLAGDATQAWLLTYLRAVLTLNNRLERGQFKET
jgi:hypothetical protein